MVLVALNLQSLRKFGAKFEEDILMFLLTLTGMDFFYQSKKSRRLFLIAWIFSSTLDSNAICGR